MVADRLLSRWMVCSAFYSNLFLLCQFSYAHFRFTQFSTMPDSSDILNRRLSPSSLPSSSQSQLASQKLRPTHSKAPIILRISRTRHNQIRPWDTTVFLQPLLQLLINRLLQFCVSSLLENLDEDELVCALEVEVRVFADDLV